MGVLSNSGGGGGGRRWVGMPAIRAPAANATNYVDGDSAPKSAPKNTPKNAGLLPSFRRKRSAKQNYIIVIDGSDRTEDTVQTSQSQSVGGAEHHGATGAATAVAAPAIAAPPATDPPASADDPPCQSIVVVVEEHASSSLRDQQRQRPTGKQRRSRSHSQSRRSRSRSCSQRRPGTRSFSRPRSRRVQETPTRSASLKSSVSPSRRHNSAPVRPPKDTTKAAPPKAASKATPTAAAAMDPQGRCSSHPFVQLRRLSHRTGEWKVFLECCPLCSAMEDDNGHEVGDDDDCDSSSSDSSVESSDDDGEYDNDNESAAGSSDGDNSSDDDDDDSSDDDDDSDDEYESTSSSTGLQPKNRQQLRPHREHRRGRQSCSQSPFHPRPTLSSLQSRSSDPRSGRRSHSRMPSNARPTSPTTTTPRRSRSHSQATRQRTSGRRTSTATPPPQQRRQLSEIRSRRSSTGSRPPKKLYYTQQRAEDLKREGFQSLGKLGCSETTVAAGSAVDQGCDSDQSAMAQAKRVRFADDDHGTTDVTHDALVTKVHTRPFTLKSERGAHFYSPGDVRRFRRQTTLDALAERALLVDEAHGADTPLLRRILFDDHLPEDERDAEEEIEEGLRGLMATADLRGLTLMSRGHRGMRRLLHREAVLYHL